MSNMVSGTAPLGKDQAAHQAGAALYGNAHHSRVEGNVISGNSSVGVALNLGSGTDHNVVTGNYIGTNASGAAPLGNTWGGLYLTEGASNNLIGGATLAEGNIIAHNGKCDFALSHVTATAADAPTNEQVSLAFSVVDSTVGGQTGQVVF